ncbi:MAG: penicillin-binding transpeptidase domain-containing protein [Clostridia bacterium]|nr:penicillin-binding transpeptidase domain-containing protein [Clostridia bacterium]
MSKYKERMIFIICILSAIVLLLFLRLFDLQVINGEEYEEQSKKRISATVTQKAPRGEIMDRNGKLLVSNREGYSVMLQKSLISNDELNKELLGIISVLEKYGYTYDDSLPISFPPYEYAFEDENGDGSIEDEREKWFENRKKITKEMSAERVMEIYCDSIFNISDEYSQEQKRKIAGIRYDASMNGFSISQPFKIAEDVDLNVITELKERQNEFKDVLVTEEYYRNYEQKDIAAHIVGGIGKMNAEEYESLKGKGYSYNDLIGKRGVEKLFEEFLKGSDGKQIVGLDNDDDGSGSNQDSQNSNAKEAIPGNYILLTIDSELQRTAEQSLEYWINEIAKKGGNPSEKKGGDANAGAAVVIDIKNGDMLVCASYPTFDPETFNSDYQSLNENESKPMWNRAISGTYTPGSTFKPAVALGALETGAVTLNEIITCEGVYKYYEDYQPKCWIWSNNHRTHGPINVTQAIEFSCNYFFYELGRRMGIDTIASYAKQLGLGELTGIEFPEEAKGNVSSREYKKKIATNEYDQKWYAGDTIQTAIGQSYSYFTPIQLANYIACIANGGTRYKTHILKSVRSSTDGSTIYEPKPQVLGQIDVSEENLEAVKKGMLGVVDEGSASAIFENYQEKIGGKTGTAQIGKNVSDNALFVAFAPFDDPEIAVAVVIERGVKGANAAYVARDIFDKYFEKNEILSNNNIIGELIR